MKSYIAKRTSKMKFLITKNYNLKELALIIFFNIFVILFTWLLIVIPFYSHLIHIIVLLSVLIILLCVEFILFSHNQEENLIILSIWQFILFLFSKKEIVNNELKFYQNIKEIKNEYVELQNNKFLKIYQINCYDLCFDNESEISNKINDFTKNFLYLENYQFDVIKTTISNFNYYFFVIYFPNFENSKLFKMQEFNNLNFELVTDNNKLQKILNEFNFLQENKITFKSKYFSNNQKQYFKILKIETYAKENLIGWAKHLFNKNYLNIMIKTNKLNKLQFEKKINQAYQKLCTKENLNKIDKYKILSDKEIYEYLLEKNAKELNNYLLIETFIIIKADNLKDLNIKLVSIKNHCKENKIVLAENNYKQDKFYNTFLGWNLNANQIQKAQEISYFALACFYPFEIKTIDDKNGYYIGKNIYTHKNSYFNSTKRDSKRTSSNILFLGKTGYGKTFNTKMHIEHNLQKQIKTFIIDAENEYQDLGKKYHAKFIDVGIGQHNINILEITSSSIVEYINYFKTILNKLYPNMNIQDSLDIANNLKFLYKTWEITDNNLLHIQNWPILTDLLNLMKNHCKNLSAIAYIQQFTEYDGQKWNSKTNVDISANLIIFNTNKLATNEKIKEIELFMLTSFLDKQIKQNYYNNMNQTKINWINLVIDEAHLLVNKFNLLTLQFIYHLTKRIRKYNGILMLITQNISDFLGDESIKSFTQGIINNMQYIFFHYLESKDITDLNEFLKNGRPLTPNQIALLGNLEVGETILKTNNEFYYIKIENKILYPDNIKIKNNRAIVQTLETNENLLI